MIRERKSITVYRFDSESREWTSFYVKDALVHSCRGVDEGLRGVKYSGQSIIRVKLKNPQDVYHGDKVVIGQHSGDCPNNALTVTSVTDNNKGSSYIRHIKLICEG